MQLDLYEQCVRLGRHEQPDAWVRVIQPDDSQYDVCRVCGFLRWPQTEAEAAIADAATWPGQSASQGTLQTQQPPARRGRTETR